MTEENEKPGGQLELPGDGPEVTGGVPEPEQVELGGEETVGELLLAAREIKGLTLESISQESKIPVGTLQYLETDNFEAIPAKVYATGFLKAYGQILGLDPAQLINKYEVQTGQTHKSKGDLWEIEEEVVEEKLDSPHLVRKFVVPVILLVAAIIILWKVFGGNEESADPVPAKTEAGQEAGTDPGGETVEAEVPVDDSADVPVDEVVREQQPPARPRQESEADPPAAGEMSLRITAEERIWFDLIIYNQTDTGLVTVEDDFILEAGEWRVFTSNESFYIRKIGKTEGFTIELDGRPYEVPIVEGRLPRDITISRDR